MDTSSKRTTPGGEKSWSGAKAARIVVACAVMVLFVALMALALSPGPQAQAQATGKGTIKVPNDYATIQAAINAAGIGDTIQVAQGTYTENLTINKSITLEGGWRSDWLTRNPAVYVTTIDGNQAGSVVSINGPCAPTVDGFVITNGKGYKGGGISVYYASPILRSNVVHHNQVTDEEGGGIYLMSSPNTLILDNEVHHNQAFYGGGLYIEISDGVTVLGNRIHDNQATGTDGRRGGGLYWFGGDGGVLAHNEICSNTADYIGGGGYYLSNGTGAITISQNLIQGNSAVVSTFAGGGGMRLSSWARAVISGNIIYSNTARWSGGLELADVASLTLINNIVARNSASKGGDGMLLSGESSLPLRGVLINNTLADNNGSTGEGIRLLTSYAAISLTNNIIAGHATGIQVDAGATVSLDYTLWHNNGTAITGSGTIVNSHPVYGDPRFVNPAGGNYHIQAVSAARDMGDPAGVPPAPPTDIDGDTRPYDVRVDIGADESTVPVLRLFLPLVLRNYL